MTLNAYLAFNGNCKEAFETYQRVLGGQIVAMMTYADMPAEYNMSPEHKDRIVHARLIVDGQALMGGDAPPDHHVTPSGTSVSVMVDTPEEAERIYNELSAGGSIMMEIQETFWAKRFAMFTDRFGTPWMVNCENPRG